MWQSAPKWRNANRLGPNRVKSFYLVSRFRRVSYMEWAVSFAQMLRDPTHLLPRCIPENCTFSDWSDWQDPTCLGALILVSELPVSPSIPKFPVAVSCAFALSLKKLLQNISGILGVMGRPLVVHTSWNLSSMLRIPICCIASTP